MFLFQLRLIRINLISFTLDGFRQTGNGSTRIDDEIPSNSNLIIQLELISWKSVTDIMGDKKVLKKIVKAGEGFDRPNEGSRAKGNFLFLYNCF